MAISGTPGGDTIPVLASVGAGSYRDVAQNLGEEILISGPILSEIPDTIGPSVVSVEVDFGYGTVTIVFTETVDITPTSMVNLSLIYSANSTGGRNVAMLGGSVSGGALIGEGIMDSMTVIIQLQEYQRIAVTRISGTGGGDGSATVMDVEANAVYDYSGNPNLANLNLQVTEIPDTVPPTIVSGQIDLNDGTLTFLQVKR